MFFSLHSLGRGLELGLSFGFLSLRAFCIEKNSTCPPLEIVGDDSLRADVMDAYVQVE